MKAIGGILLAAGEASRFGKPKQAATVGGETLLQRAAGQLLAADLQARVVVLGAHRQAVAPLLPDQLPTVDNPHWAAGMLGSLQAGLRFLLAAADRLDGIFVMAADQPDFSAAQIDRYLAAARAENELRPVLTGYAQGAGLPFVVPATTFERILALPRNGKLRPLLADLAQAIVLPEGPHLRDIDTQQDLANWLGEQTPDKHA
jgi:molybdenum cofactor cytidylyltransferase